MMAENPKSDNQIHSNSGKKLLNYSKTQYSPKSYSHKVPTNHFPLKKDRLGKQS
jgi:hypothetical protein